MSDMLQLVVLTNESRLKTKRQAEATDGLSHSLALATRSPRAPLKLSILKSCLDDLDVTFCSVDANALSIFDQLRRILYAYDCG